jgi:hypothetical protein
LSVYDVHPDRPDVAHNVEPEPIPEDYPLDLLDESYVYGSDDVAPLDTPFRDVPSSPATGYAGPWGRVGQHHINLDAGQARAWREHEDPPRQDTSTPAIAGDVPGSFSGRPATTSEGPGTPDDPDVERTAATQPGATKSMTRELRKLSFIGDTGPDRLHVTYHVVLTETRGNAKVTYRTVPVGTQPVQILSKDEDRHLAQIIVAVATADGSFVALADRNLQGFNWNPTLGMPPMPNVFLLPTTSPTFVYKVEHVEELWACFVPNPSIGTLGQTAILSIEMEFGDAALRREAASKQTGPVQR